MPIDQRWRQPFAEPDVLGPGSLSATLECDSSVKNPRDLLERRLLGWAIDGSTHVPGQHNPLSPRPLFCVIEDAHADLQVAVDACDGRFTEVGQQVTLPIPPDWAHARLPADIEWRIAWQKFYFGLDLSAAFAQTGEARFFETWKTLVSSFVEQVAPDAEQDCHVVGRRVLNWLYAWSRFARQGAELDASEAARIYEHLRQQVGFVRAHLTLRRNHRTIELTSLFLATLAFPSLDPDGCLRSEVVELLADNLWDDFLDDGVHVERSTHYHMMALRNFLSVRVNAARYGVTLPERFDQRLHRAADFALHCHRPDGGIAAISDADSGSYQDLLSLAAEQLHRDDLRFVASAGSVGVAPATHGDFPRGGYFTHRAHWGMDAPYLIWDCGPVGEGGHGHYDMLHFEASAGGRPLVIDPGRYTYDESGANWRRWFKGTAAHNTVCVDGLDQSPYHCWDSPSSSAQTARAELLRCDHADGLDVLTGRVLSPCYDAEHRRTILFVDRAFWLVEDRLESETEHDYDLRFHLTHEARGRVGTEKRGATTAVLSPGLILLSSGYHAVQVEEGWVAPLYGQRLPAPIASIRQSGKSVDFVTALLPFDSGDDPPELSVRRTQAEVSATLRWSDGSCHTVRWRERTACWQRYQADGKKSTESHATGV